MIKISLARLQLSFSILQMKEFFRKRIKKLENDLESMEFH